MSLEIRTVEWTDSVGNGGWHSLAKDKDMPPDRIQTVGYVIAETDKHVTLVQSFTNRKDASEDQGDNSISIPKVAILKSRTLIKGKS